MAVPDNFLEDIQVPPATARRALTLQSPTMLTLPGPPAPEAPAQEAPPERDMDEFRGLFGLRGTPRDVLGILGDAFLIQSGNDPRYAQRRQLEREAEAMGGFVDNPLEAIERLGQANPEAAREFYTRHLAETRLGRQANEDYSGTVLDRAYRMLAAANEQNYPQIKERVLSYLRARGVEPPADLPASYDPEAIRGARQMAVDVYRQIDDEDMAIHRQAQREADATYRNARLEDYDLDRAVRQQGIQNTQNYRGERIQDFDADRDVRREIGTEPTPNTVLGSIMEKMRAGEELTPSEQQIYSDYQNRGRGGRRQPVNRQGNRPAPRQSRGPARVRSAADYNALPSGAEFIDPNGVRRRKP